MTESVSISGEVGESLEWGRAEASDCMLVHSPDRGRKSTSASNQGPRVLLEPELGKLNWTAYAVQGGLMAGFVEYPSLPRGVSTQPLLHQRFH